MTYSSTYDSNNNVNIISINGNIPAIKLIPLIHEVFTEHDFLKTKAVLFDIRHITIENSIVSLVEFFENERSYKINNVDLSIALLYSEQPDVFRFIENAGAYRGWNIRAFNDLTQGLGWLTA